MAINKYDQPAQSRFINTYSPVPFQELAAAAQARQNKADENYARIAATQSMLDQIGYIPNSEDQRRVEGWQNQLSSLADDYLDKDLSDPEVYRRLRTNLKTIVNPNDVRAVQQSYAGYQDYQKTAQQMQARGEQIYNPTDFTGYSTKSQGIFAGYPTMDLGEQARIKIDAFLKRPQVSDTPFYEELSGRYGTIKKRDLGQIYDLINSNTDELTSDPAIQQFMESHGMDENSFKQYLHELAPNYEVNDIQNLAWMPGTGEEGDGTGEISTSQGPGMSKSGGSEHKGFRGRREIKRNTPDITELVPGLKFKKEGSILDNETIDNFFTGKGGREKKLEFSSEEDKNTFDAYAKAAADYYGVEEFNSLTDKEKVKQINDYITFKYQQQRNPEVYEYTEGELPKETKILDAQIKLQPLFANRDVYDLNKPQDQQLSTVRELLDKYPPEGGFTWSPVGRTSDIPRQEMAAAKQIEIKDDNGKTVGTYYIAGSEEERSRAAFANQLTTALLYSTLPEGNFEVPLTEDGGISADVSWKVHEKQGQLPVYEVMITYPDGTGIGPISSTSVADLKYKIAENTAYFAQ